MKWSYSFLVIFYAVQVALFSFGVYQQYADTRLNALNRIGISVAVSRGAALVLTIDAAVILLPVCRNLIRMVWTRYIPFEKSLWFHRHIAYSMLMWTMVHTGAHYVNFIKIEQLQIRPQKATQMLYAEPAGVTGLIMLVLMFIFYTAAHATIRTACYELFWVSHHLSLLFLLTLFLHATGCFVRDSLDPVSPFAGRQFWQHCLGYQGWRWEIWAFGLYLGERIVREIRARKPTTFLGSFLYTGEVIELRLSKDSMRYRPGQWLFMNVPALSSIQWHPFTITSCPLDPFISIHVHIAGDFTRRLSDMLQRTRISDVRIKLDGPYGAPASDVFCCDSVVLVAAGIGITPWSSILRNVAAKQANGGTKIYRIDLIWICRDPSTLAAFLPLLQSVEQKFQMFGNRSILHIHIWLTAKIPQETVHNIYMHSAGATVDPITKLMSKCNYGRPDFLQVLDDIQTQLVVDSRIQNDWILRSKCYEIDVFVCGSQSLTDAVKRACRSVSSNCISFRFRQEHF